MSPIERLKRIAERAQREYRRAQLKEQQQQDPPLCKCGCGRPVAWKRGVGWNVYLKGHQLRRHYFEGPPPSCACGCWRPVRFRPGYGWNIFLRGHGRKNRPTTDDHREKIKKAHRQRHAGTRLRDREEKPGRGVYNSFEYRDAKEQLVVGRSCQRCGSTKNVAAHHETAGDDSTLVPCCRKCHPTVHAAPGAHGRNPPPGESAPLCACGCERSVSWKRVRGWAKYCKGHGTAKIPTRAPGEAAPLCGCGCGEAVKYTFGKGWNKYKRGHGQRIEGAYHKRERPPAPLCKCGCGKCVEWIWRSGYPLYLPSHRSSTRGRKPPLGSEPPLCACGCGASTNWQPGKGWSQFLKGHHRRKEGHCRSR